jgi:ssDNA-binding Zn-finger/Zn-ribbon topoisomerase 1
VNEYSVLSKYKKVNIKILFKHNICGNEFYMTPGNFLQGQRCPECMKKKIVLSRTKTHKEFLNDVYNLTGNEYSVLSNYINNKEKIKIRHNICGYEYFTRPNDFLSGCRCPKCNESKGEKLISKILNNLTITYKSQYVFDDCKNINVLPFDFAIFDKNNILLFLIEYQGEMHFMPTRYTKDKDKLLKNLNYINIEIK